MPYQAMPRPSSVARSLPDPAVTPRSGRCDWPATQDRQRRAQLPLAMFAAAVEYVVASVGDHPNSIDATSRDTASEAAEPTTTPTMGAFNPATTIARSTESGVAPRPMWMPISRARVIATNEVTP